MVVNFWFNGAFLGSGVVLQPLKLLFCFIELYTGTLENKIALFAFPKTSSFAVLGQNFTPFRPINFAMHNSKIQTKMAVPTDATIELTSSKISVCFVRLLRKDHSKIVSFSDWSWQKVQPWTVLFDLSALYGCCHTCYSKCMNKANIDCAEKCKARVEKTLPCPFSQDCAGCGILWTLSFI